MDDSELMGLAVKHEEYARLVAGIVGPASGAAKAIAAVEEDRAVGKIAAIICQGNAWVVVRPGVCA